MNALAPITRTARIIVTDPFERRQDVHDVPAGGTLADALMDLSPDRWGGAHIELYDGAITAAGALPLDEARAIPLEAGRIYHVVKVPAEPVSIAGLIISAAGVAAGSTAAILITVAVYIAIMAVTMALSYLVSMLLAPGKQSQKALASEDQPSALNSLSPPRNMFRIGSRVPEIYGRLRFWPDLIFNATSRWSPVGWESDLSWGAENPNATSQQIVRAVYCLGRGHFQMTDFQFGDSPVANANGAVYVYPPGVTLPSWVTATYGAADLSRQELGGPGAPNMWSPWYTLPSDEVSQIDVQISFPQGLIRAYSGKKVPPNFHTPQAAHIETQFERLDQNGNVVETRSAFNAVQSKTRNELRITFSHSLPTGKWRLRVAETLVQPWFPNGNTEIEFNKAVLEGIVGHRYLTDAERTYEHETCLIVEASNVGSPALQNLEAFNLMAARVLPTQDVPGIMTEWRADARWITAAINTLTDPYICGYGMDEVDWPSLHAVQASLEAYPEGFAEGEFNAALDRQMTADEQLMLVARKARAYVFPSGGRITFARDERRSGVSALFNRRNRLAGRAEVGLGLQFKQRDDPDGVIVSFIDATDNYRQNTYTYPEGITPAAPLSMDLIGAVYPHEVCRRARFEYAVMKYRRRSMPLRVTEEGQLLLPTERVAVVMPWNEGTIDGEVLEIDGTDLRLDRPVPALIASARIRLRREDGMATQLLGLINSPRGPEWVTLGALPAFEIIVPTEDQQLGTLYSLSQMEADDKATFWFVTGAQVDDAGVTLTLGEDSDEVFQLSDDLLDPCVDAPPPEPGCRPILTPVGDAFVIHEFTDSGTGDVGRMAGRPSDRDVWEFVVGYVDGAGETLRTRVVVDGGSIGSEVDSGLDQAAAIALCGHPTMSLPTARADAYVDWVFSISEDEACFEVDLASGASTFGPEAWAPAGAIIIAQRPISGSVSASVPRGYVVRSVAAVIGEGLYVPGDISYAPGAVSLPASLTVAGDLVAAVSSEEYSPAGLFGIAWKDATDSSIHFDEVGMAATPDPGGRQASDGSATDVMPLGACGAAFDRQGTVLWREWTSGGGSPAGRVMARTTDGPGGGFLGPPRQIFPQVPLTGSGYTHLASREPVASLVFPNGQIVMVERRYELAGASDWRAFEVLTAYSAYWDSGLGAYVPDFDMQSDQTLRLTPEGVGPTGDVRRSAAFVRYNPSAYGAEFHVLWESPTDDLGGTELRAMRLQLEACVQIGEIE